MNIQCVRKNKFQSGSRSHALYGNIHFTNWLLERSFVVVGGYLIRHSLGLIHNATNLD